MGDFFDASRAALAGGARAGISPDLFFSNCPRAPFPMAERTFSIIKPDATQRNLTGKINAVIETAGLRIVGQKRIRMSRAQAETFYEIHKQRPFYGELVDFMTSAPVVVQVLEGDNAVV